MKVVALLTSIKNVHVLPVLNHYDKVVPTTSQVGLITCKLGLWNPDLNTVLIL